MKTVVAFEVKIGADDPEVAADDVGVQVGVAARMTDPHVVTAADDRHLRDEVAVAAEMIIVMMEVALLDRRIVSIPVLLLLMLKAPVVVRTTKTTTAMTTAQKLGLEWPLGHLLATKKNPRDPNVMTETTAAIVAIENRVWITAAVVEAPLQASIHIANVVAVESALANDSNRRTTVSRMTLRAAMTTMVPTMKKIVQEREVTGIAAKVPRIRSTVVTTIAALDLAEVNEERSDIITTAIGRPVPAAVLRNGKSQRRGTNVITVGKTRQKTEERRYLRMVHDRRLSLLTTIILPIATLRNQPPAKSRMLKNEVRLDYSIRCDVAMI